MEQQRDAARFVLCLRNDEYPTSLEPRKVYEVIPDPAAERHDLIRIVDESGEDYLFPRTYFLELEPDVSDTVERGAPASVVAHR